MLTAKTSLESIRQTSYLPQSECLRFPATKGSSMVKTQDQCLSQATVQHSTMSLSPLFFPNAFIQWWFIMTYICSSNQLNSLDDHNVCPIGFRQ
jgi:hypothetical protein